MNQLISIETMTNHLQLRRYLKRNILILSIQTEVWKWKIAKLGNKMKFAVILSKTQPEFRPYNSYNRLNWNRKKSRTKEGRIILKHHRANWLAQQKLPAQVTFKSFLIHQNEKLPTKVTLKLKLYSLVQSMMIRIILKCLWCLNVNQWWLSRWARREGTAT